MTVTPLHMSVFASWGTASFGSNRVCGGLFNTGAFSVHVHMQIRELRSWILLDLFWDSEATQMGRNLLIL